MIKFRAWHKNREKMKFLHKIEWLTSGSIFVYLLEDIGVNDVPHIIETNWLGENIELMQWTGLQDKDGREIFEGDILCYDFVGGVDTYMIERNPDDNQLHAKYIYMSGYNTEHLGDVPVHASVVIGNYLENPELLEST